VLVLPVLVPGTSWRALALLVLVLPASVGAASVGARHFVESAGPHRGADLQPVPGTLWRALPGPVRPFLESARADPQARGDFLETLA